MTELLLAESQPNFPNEDLSEESALYLGLMMQNQEALNFQHNIAENSSFLYRFGHPALVSTMNSCFAEISQVKAFEHGIATYESIGAYATLQFERPGHNEAAVLTYMNVPTVSFDPIIKLSEVTDQFVNKMPHTKAVILEAASRFFPYHINYAIGGAAMAYYLETDIISQLESNKDVAE